MTASTALNGAAAKAIKEDIARANGYLRRNDLNKALEFAIKALQQRAGALLTGVHRLEIEFSLEEFSKEFVRHPQAEARFNELMILPSIIKYIPGKEKQTAQKMALVLHRFLGEQDKAQAMEEMRVEAQRKNLLKKARKFIDAGDIPHGRAIMRRLAETHGRTPGVLTTCGELLLNVGMPHDAIPFLELALKLFPNDQESYTLLVRGYIEEHEFEKGEAVYLKALKQFGAHPRTYLHMSKLYLAWRKTEKAFQYAKQALAEDPSLSEAREIIKKTA